MKNTGINLKVIDKVAKALGELNDRVVFVGGAIVSLYINDPAASLMKPKLCWMTIFKIESKILFWMIPGLLQLLIN